MSDIAERARRVFAVEPVNEDEKDEEELKRQRERNDVILAIQLAQDKLASALEQLANDTHIADLASLTTALKERDVEIDLLSQKMHALEVRVGDRKVPGG